MLPVKLHVPPTVVDEGMKNYQERFFMPSNRRKE
jgi:hypothetical protein